MHKFYTKPEVVTECMHQFRNNIHVQANDWLIDPAAGNGSFIPEFQQLCIPATHRLLLDVLPEHEDIIQQDYLTFDVKSWVTPSPSSRIHVITNPPFGRNACLARRFIAKSCEFCDTLSLILPKSFKKQSMQSSIPALFHLRVQLDLPAMSFLWQGVLEYDVPCCFQIWEKQTTPRAVPELASALYFSFVKWNEDPHVSFRRVGHHAGQVECMTRMLAMSVSSESHYFLRFTNDRSLDENVHLLRALHFDHDNTVAQKSICKQELLTAFNRAYSASASVKGQRLK